MKEPSKEVLIQLRKDRIQSRRKFSLWCRAQLREIRTGCEGVMAGEPGAWEQLDDAVRRFTNTVPGYISVLDAHFLTFKDSPRYCEEVGKTIGRLMRLRTYIGTQWRKAKNAHDEYESQLDT